MNRRRDLLRVSCKCALFNLDGSKVLLADYGREGFGLPGGHVDIGERPDDAIKRELFEELGLKDVALRRADFFLHPNGKIVLAYVANIDESTIFTVQQEEIDGAVWTEVALIKSGTIKVSSYKDFILNHRP